jgi:dTDP-4-amino-4,6-dideoxygalactose transaminase
MSDAVARSETVAPVPLVDLRAAHAEVADAIAAGMQRVIADTAFVLGPDVAAFEAEFAAFCGVRRCVGLSNGTDALELALRSLDIGPGDEVVLPTNTFIATALAVLRAGATPVLADCDDEHLLVDPDSVATRLTARARALMPVHLYGQIAPMEALQQVLDGVGRPVEMIEDAAQAQGARRNGRAAGSLGRVAATSFYPGKNLGAYGDAGAVMTDDVALADKLVALRNYGSPRKYQHPEPGFNCRLDTLQAVVLRAKLPLLAAWNAQRRAAAARYDAWLASVDELRPVRTLPGNEHIFHVYAVRVRGGAERRDRVLAKLHEARIGAGVHYPEPLHLTGALRALGHRRGDFPVAEAACGELLSLPLYPQITVEQQERVVDALTRALRS